ncbi:hypothetical protein [Sphingomicrobium sediminis]|uniref:Uncharacterized protein n=1 Tax=Sphingomicrobium sediminis TaxID=2950949 RepID=A0A9X2EN57_9SPHN|nr:hypothetical protein [Sphingomicrobium sediminis]MCM8558484.1 hypothetical protein [Sphingomicrobium sediminis]
MARHERDFGGASPISREEAAHLRDLVEAKNRRNSDALIRFLAGEEDAAPTGGAFARSSGLTPDKQS